LTLLKIFKIDGCFINEVAHLKIHRKPSNVFVVSLLIEKLNQRTDSFPICFLTKSHASTVLLDVIASLKKDIPMCIKKRTEVYFEGKLLMLLSPTK
jgi:hypothetical protein